MAFEDTLRIMVQASNDAGGRMGGGYTKASMGNTDTMEQIAESAQAQVMEQRAQKTWMHQMFKAMGIQVGISSILKQSQIFTSSVGAIFQILGGFIDVMLAPFMPLIVPVLRKFAQLLPVFKVWMETAMQKLAGLWEWLKDVWPEGGLFGKDNHGWWGALGGALFGNFSQRKHGRIRRSIGLTVGAIGGQALANSIMGESMLPQEGGWGEDIMNVINAVLIPTLGYAAIMKGGAKGIGMVRRGSGKLWGKIGGGGRSRGGPFGGRAGGWASGGGGPRGGGHGWSGAGWGKIANLLKMLGMGALSMMKTGPTFITGGQIDWLEQQNMSPYGGQASLPGGMGGGTNIFINVMDGERQFLKNVERQTHDKVVTIININSLLEA